MAVATVVRVGHPITGRLVVRFPLSPLKKIELLAMADVPLSTAPHPMLPGRCEWLPTAPVYGICLHVCVQQVPTWMGQMRRSNFV